MLLVTGMSESGPDVETRIAEAGALADKHNLLDVKARLASRAFHLPIRQYRWDDAVALGEATLAAQEAAADVHYTGHIYGDVAQLHLLAGRLEESARAADQAIAYARQAGLPGFVELAQTQKMSVALLRGDMETAAEQRPEGQSHWGGVAAALIYLLTGRIAEAVRTSENISMVASTPLDAARRGIVASVRLADGDTSGAREAFDLWLSALAPDGFSLLMLNGLNTGLYALDLADAAELETIYAIAVLSPDTPAAYALPLDPWRARLALRLDRPQEAAQWLAAGRAWAESEGATFAEAECELVAAELAQYTGDLSAASQHAERAAAMFGRMGAIFRAEPALKLKMSLQGLADIDTTSSIDAVAASLGAERPDLSRQAAPDGTVTLLFSDIENSTARTAELGDAQWMTLLREHNAIVRDQLAAHGGFEVKSMGDGFMLAFRSAVDGLRCAVGMQRAFAERNAQADKTIRVRIGLHTGEAIKEADDFFGSHVNLAARVGGAAQGDEILVSGLLKALTEPAGEFTFDAGREVELKGITGPQQVHAVEWRS